MKGFVFRALALAWCIALAASPVRAADGDLYTWSSDGGFSRTFTLHGGQYKIYVNAHQRPVLTTQRTGCQFGGAFQQVTPKHESVHLGPGIPISTGIGYTIGPKLVNLDAGTYELFITTLTTCRWTFTIFSDPEGK